MQRPALIPHFLVCYQSPRADQASSLRRRSGKCGNFIADPDLLDCRPGAPKIWCRVGPTNLGGESWCGSGVNGGRAFARCDVAAQRRLRIDGRSGTAQRLAKPALAGAADARCCHGAGNRFTKDEPGKHSCAVSGSRNTLLPSWKTSFFHIVASCQLLRFCPCLKVHACIIKHA